MGTHAVAADVALEPVRKLSRDLKAAAVTLTPSEVRYLVDTYYQLQEQRKRAANQVLALSGAGEPHVTLAWFEDQFRGLEGELAKALDAYSAGQPLGRWARAQVGIGPIIAAGLLAHIDLVRCVTYGQVWRFAGLDPTQKWLGKEKAAAYVKTLTGATDVEAAVVLAARHIGCRPETMRAWATTGKDGEPRPLTWAHLAAAAARRPWNAQLKVLSWKIGDSFVKVSGRETAYYGAAYRQRKAQETANSEGGRYAETAAEGLARVGKGTEAAKWYAQGKLPPGRLDLRARRWAVKLFLSHYWYVGRKLLGLPCAEPYPVMHLDGHTHTIPPPAITTE